MSTALPLLDEPVKAAKRRGVGCIEILSEQKRIKLPLSAVQLHARVAGCLAHVTVTETFQNPFSDHLEAVYIFPLPGGCAVSSFQMKVGERIIDGRVDERQAARQEYAEAMQQGKRAALLEQDRDDVFTVQVGNLPPGEEITVILTYSEKLAYFDNGTSEIRLPLVVAPRYIPGAPLERDSVGEGVEMDTDIVPDASRITPPRLAPGVDAKIDLNISVELAGGETIEDLSCSQHAMRMGAKQDGVTVSLARVDELLDRDFVLRWRVATDSVQSNFRIYCKPKDAGKGAEAGKGAGDSKQEYYGMVSIVPPMDNDIVTPARDVIFVLDRSGSMQGLKMVSAARACSFLLATLGPSDRFAIQAFDQVSEWLTASDGSYFFDADEAGQDVGVKFLRKVVARGGTELHSALDGAIAVMDKRRSKAARMPVIVVLTDGEVGNESSIFKYIQSKLGDSRVFTVGIDTAVNDGFLRRLAALGGGTATFVEPGAQLEAALSHVGREIGRPLITDLAIEEINCGLHKNSIAPNNLSDLFEGRAVNAFFKLSAAKVKDLSKAKIRLKGKYADGKDFAEEVCATTTDVPALPQLWAKAFVVDLEDQYRLAGGKTQESLKNEIVAVAVEHSLLTKFTAFVVVDHSQVVNQDGTARKVVQPVQMPAKWEEQISAPTQTYAGGYGAASMQAPMPAPRAAFFQAPADQMETAGWGAPPPTIEGIGRSGERRPDSSKIGNIGCFKLDDADRAKLAALGSGDGSGQAPGQADSWHPVNSALPPQSPQPPSSPSPAPPPAPSPQSQPQHKRGKNIFPHHLNDDAIDKLFSENLGVSAYASAPASSAKLPAAPEAAANGDPDYFQHCYKIFEQALRLVLESLAQGRLPDCDKLDLARGELLKALAISPVASKLPLLQKYLRADLLNLLAALSSVTTVSQKLKDLGREHEQKFERVAEEVSQQMPVEQQPFWEATV